MEVCIAILCLARQRLQSSRGVITLRVCNYASVLALLVNSSFCIRSLFRATSTCISLWLKHRSFLADNLWLALVKCSSSLPALFFPRLFILSQRFTRTPSIDQLVSAGPGPSPNKQHDTWNKMPDRWWDCQFKIWKFFILFWIECILVCLWNRRIDRIFLRTWLIWSLAN